MISDKDMDKAWELCGKIGVEEYETIEALYDMAEWKDKQFAVLLRTELATWQGNSAEAKYRREMLKELLEKLK